MNWNDGISKQFEVFFNESLKNIGPAALEAYIEIIDEETQMTFERLENTTPKNTGDLAKSLKKSKVIGSSGYYGYKIIFEGNNEKGVPYQKIANVLNYGSFNRNIAPTRFIDKTIRKLKNMDERIAKRYDEKIRR